MITEKIKKNIYSLLLIFLSVAIVAIWFRKGIMIAKAEEGIPFYDLERTLRIYGSYFYDSGMGLKGVFNIPRTPLFYFLSFFQKFGIPGWAIQASVFLFLIVTPLLTIPRLLNKIYPKQPKIIGFTAAIFYLLNLFTLSQVWTRFISPSMFLWSYLPLFLYLWFRYVQLFKSKYLLLLLLTSFIYSPAFVTISPLVTLWFAASLLTLTIITKAKEKFRIKKYSIVGFLFWVFTNLWWIYPFINVKDTNLSSNDSYIQNLKSLTDVSIYFPNKEVFLLRQKYMFGPDSPYYDFYKGNFTYTLSYLIMSFVAIGLIVTSKSKKNSKFPIFLFLVGWFLAKGVNPPFGEEFYSFMFDKFPVSQIYRNSYEKIGPLYLLGYSFLFAIGIVWVTSKLKKLQFPILALFLSFFCGYLLTPLFNGKHFKNEDYVIVPTYYKAINESIENKDKSETRILQLPYLRGSQVKFDWNYFGEEPSEFLFDKASVSRTTSNPTMDEFYYMVGDYRTNIKFPNILSVMKIKYIVLHKDVITSTYHFESADESRSIINTWVGVEPLEKVDKLELYRNKLTSDSRIYLANQIYETNGLKETLEVMTSEEFNPNSDIVINTATGGLSTQLIENLETPDYSIEMLSRSKYRVRITNNNRPFIVVLANNFDKSWHAKIENKIIEDHFLVNGFANGWYVDRIGDYYIDVLYKVWPWQ